jgi:hypothetical protein
LPLLSSSSLPYGCSAGETSSAISELKGLLTERVGERRKVTDNIIRKFIMDQENTLKHFIKRANEDFQSIKM